MTSSLRRPWVSETLMSRFSVGLRNRVCRRKKECGREEEEEQWRELRDEDNNRDYQVKCVLDLYTPHLLLDWTLHKVEWLV